MNVSAAHHAFDLRDDNETSRAVIARTLDFMKAQTQESAQKEISAGLQEATAAGAAFRGDSATALREYAALAAGRPRDTEFQLALDTGNPNRGWISYSAAAASMKLGDMEAALKWVENLKDIPPMRRQLKSDPNFASLKDDPRFKAVAEQN